MFKFFAEIVDHHHVSHASAHFVETPTIAVGLISAAWFCTSILQIGEIATVRASADVRHIAAAVRVTAGRQNRTGTQSVRVDSSVRTLRDDDALRHNDAAELGLS